ncbi:Shikimate kinase [compost metagenome]
MRRLLEGPPIVLATGGGAMMNPETRALMKQHSVSVWMRADLKVIAERVQRRDTRPLLRGRDPLEALSQLAEARYPIYAEADLTVDVGGGSHGQAVEAIIRELRRHAREETKR